MIRDEFDKEKIKSKDLLDKQLGLDWPEREKISTWSLSQLLLRVIFNRKDVEDSEWNL